MFGLLEKIIFEVEKEWDLPSVEGFQNVLFKDTKESMELNIYRWFAWIENYKHKERELVELFIGNVKGYLISLWLKEIDKKYVPFWIINPHDSLGKIDVDLKYNTLYQIFLALFDNEERDKLIDCFYTQCDWTENEKEVVLRFITALFKRYYAKGGDE